MTTVDGRVRRGARNREAIIDALIACYEAGEVRPSLPDIARRAGLSVRSVHNHFEDVETLRAEVAQRQWERHAHLLGAATSVDELVRQRAALFEALTPVRRAALLSVHDSPTIARNLARLDRLLRRQLVATFPDLSEDTLDACDALASWDTWNRLRAAQGCSAARARRIVTQSVSSVLEGSRS